MNDLTSPEGTGDHRDNPWRDYASIAKEIGEKERPVNYSEIVGNNIVIFLAENHSNTSIRRHIARRADQLKAAGITHYAIEASDKGKTTFDKLNAGDLVDLSKVDVGPGREDYEDAIYAMSAAGVKVVPIDIDQSTKTSKEEREAQITANIEAILNSDPTAKVAVLIGGFHTSRNYVSEGVPSTGKRLMDKGVTTVNVQFTGGEVAIPTSVTGPVRDAGKASKEFMIDMKPYQNFEGVPFGKGESDYLIHLPQIAGSYATRGGFGNLGFIDIDLSNLKP